MKNKLFDKEFEDMSEKEKKEYAEYLEAEHEVLIRLREVVQARKRNEKKKRLFSNYKKKS